MLEFATPGVSYANVLSLSNSDYLLQFTSVDGQMSAPARAESLDKIRNDKRCRVILISFKAGGVGEPPPTASVLIGSTLTPRKD